MAGDILIIRLREEQDAVLARQRTRQLAGRLGFNSHDQTRLATAVSELSRNALAYAGGGKVVFRVKSDAPAMLVVRVEDGGKGFADLPAVLEGRPDSSGRAGVGIVAARRLTDHFHIESSRAGTRIEIGKHFPKNAAPPSPAQVAAAIEEIAKDHSRSTVDEVLQQNRELLESLAELQARQAEIERLNRELSETNRGVVALYAELDEKAAALQRVSEHKSRFLSTISHELRTPLNSIRSLSRLLLDRIDGPLTDEQQRQVRYIQGSAEGLTDMVNDLLDLAKIEAGRIDIRPSRFHVAEVFAGLRGMFRPLVESKSVALVLAEPEEIDALHTDEQKVTQVLRNLISNALKFTRQGQVRVCVKGHGDDAVFSVSDSGIGIAPEHQHRIFDEYSQIDSPIQRTVVGTGLGLPLSRKLAELLGGSLTVQSQPGEGSTFTFRVPKVFQTDPSGDLPISGNLRTQAVNA